MRALQQSWYRRQWWSVLLWPLSLLFRGLSLLRRLVLARTAARRPHPVPIIVVGNITVGGTGKTPLLIRLARELIATDCRPGIISRGYGGPQKPQPVAVKPQSDPAECGDEPVLIAQRTDCPVVVDPDRYRAYQFLCEQHDVDVVLSDDGLQHYGLPRDMEIILIDGQRLVGNGMCLPAGPLREPVSRLSQADHVIINDPGDAPVRDRLPSDLVEMRIKPRFLVNLKSGEKKPVNGAPFNIGATVHVVSGVGNPDRFFAALKHLPYTLRRHDFPDHHPFTAEELAAIDEYQPIVMTEKDAVKCRKFARPNHWYLAAETELPKVFIQQFVSEVRKLVDIAAAASAGARK